MSSVHDTITEALRAHRPSAKWCEHGGLLCSCGHHSCGRQTDHAAVAVLAALESRGFVVRKQVEPPALRQEWTWSWPNGSARGVPGYGYPVDSAEEALAEAGVHDRRNANVVTRFVSEWQQVEP